MRGLRFTRNRTYRHRRGSERQPDDESAATPTPFAVRLDGARMQLDEPAHEREPDPEPAMRAIRALLALREQVEDPRQQLGCNAASRVFDLQHAMVAILMRMH